MKINYYTAKQLPEKVLNRKSERHVLQYTCRYKYVWCHNHGIMWLICMSYSQHTRRKSKQYHLPSCISTVSTVCMQQHELWTYFLVDHTPRCRSTAAAWTHHCKGDNLALLERRICHQTMTKDRPRLLLRSRPGGMWPAEQASRNMRHFALFIRECISMATLVCAHGTTILTNCGPPELAAEGIFYALQVRTQTRWEKW